MDQSADEIYEEGLAAAKAWRDAERRKYADTDEGNWLLRALAAESGGRLAEVEPGRFFESKLPNGGLG